MCVGEPWIEREGFAVGDDGILLSIQVLEQHRQIESQQRFQLPGPAVYSFRFAEPARGQSDIGLG